MHVHAGSCFLVGIHRSRASASKEAHSKRGVKARADGMGAKAHVQCTATVQRCACLGLAVLTRSRQLQAYNNGCRHGRASQGDTAEDVQTGRGSTYRTYRQHRSRLTKDTPKSHQQARALGCGVEGVQEGTAPPMVPNGLPRKLGFKPQPIPRLPWTCEPPTQQPLGTSDPKPHPPGSVPQTPRDSKPRLRP